ncbi:TraB/VirB10 family protein [Burkholderia gladioli]|uniref:Sex pilus assembly protein TraB n=1 Tax=Burkholderia gladioli (strain BSR3) TaxID=999541 RepID=F2LSG6_BURGS|nr:TraB/VirB10 family protein [Burkholderia gladioli]AEA65762.1 sex pilus assembly protein TraB [Burkholderia gladioli BSR3]
MKLLDNLIRSWKLADADKRKRMMVGAASVGIIAGFFLMSKASHKPPPSQDTTLDTTVVEPPKRNVDLETLNATLTSVQRQMQDSTVHLNNLDQQMQQVQSNLMNRINDVASGKMTDKNLQQHIDDTITKEVATEVAKQHPMGQPGLVSVPGMPGSNLNPASTDPSYPTLPLGPGGADASKPGGDTPAKPALQLSDDDSGDSANGANGASDAAGGSAAPLHISPNASDADRATAANTSHKQETWLPAGALFSGVLINGMDAPASQASQRQPTPVLIRVKKDAILPNYYTADIKECFVLASGYGSMSSERAYMRTERLSCIRNDGGVIETALDGYITGEDGKVGMRGRLVSKEGAVIARTLAAGFIGAFGQGLSTGLSGASQYGGGLTISSQQQIPMSTVIRDSAGAGIGNAFDRVAEFYLDIAKEMVPVVEVDAGREADIILVHGVSLKLGQH